MASPDDSAAIEDDVAPGPDHATRTARLLVLGFIGAVGAVVIGLPLWASLTYRSAVHDLHDELGGVHVASADVVRPRIERCWNGVAPASVRELVPNGEQTLTDVAGDYVAELARLGFERHPGLVGTVASRPRNDDLDDDVITVVYDDADGRVILIADPFDADMVTCLPF